MRRPRTTYLWIASPSGHSDQGCGDSIPRKAWRGQCQGAMMSEHKRKQLIGLVSETDKSSNDKNMGRSRHQNTAYSREPGVSLKVTIYRSSRLRQPFRRYRISRRPGDVL